MIDRSNKVDAISKFQKLIIGRWNFKIIENSSLITKQLNNFKSTLREETKRKLID